MRYNRENGQAVLLVLVAMSIFMIAAIGLAIDGGQMYAHKQMAQAAADAAAQAAMMSIFSGTNGLGTHAFSTTSLFTCTTTDARTPCVYAQNNGFGNTTDDTITIDFPTAAQAFSSSPPGVNLGSDPVSLVRATVQRTLTTGLIRFVGPSTSTIKALAVAAIVDVMAPVPILVTQPKLPSTFYTNGTTGIQICGGPTRSIQVNSSDPASVNSDKNSTVDLSTAGPQATVACDNTKVPPVCTCSGGTGADFGNWGGPKPNTFGFLPGTLPGKYIEPAEPILDPLALVNPPGLSYNGTPRPVDPAIGSITTATQGCVGPPCDLYSPGVYRGGINSKNNTVFTPGVYIMTDKGGTPQGFSNAAGGNMYMGLGFSDDPETGQGMLVYDTGTQTNANGETITGGFSITGTASANMMGSCDTLTCNTYKGILFFENRNAAPTKKPHEIGGGGCIDLYGTIYLNNSLAFMTSHPNDYQTLILHGNPCSGTELTGEIIVNALQLKGTSAVTMTLNPNTVLHIRQVALVK